MHTNAGVVFLFVLQNAVLMNLYSFANGMSSYLTLPGCQSSVLFRWSR
jgi:hypothetical protein